MSIAAATSLANLADLLERLGDIPPRRVRLNPAIGTAEKSDLANAEGGRQCELVEGTLVEKAMGIDESFIAGILIEILSVFVRTHQLGAVGTPDGAVELREGLVRAPDVSFFSNATLANRKDTDAAIPRMTPDLAVEVLSRSNTEKEMKQKRQEYFDAGVRTVWIVNRFSRTVQVYESETKVVSLAETETLRGGEVLPGFSVSVREIFQVLDHTKPSGSGE